MGGSFRDVSYNDLEQVLDQLQVQIAVRPWFGIMALARGGLYPALCLSHRLSIQRVESVLVQSYNGSRTQQTLSVLSSCVPCLDNQGEGYLIVDDLVDSGQTMAWAAERWPRAYRVALYAKPLGQKVCHAYGALVNQETWIVFPWEKGKDT